MNLFTSLIDRISVGEPLPGFGLAELLADELESSSKRVHSLKFASIAAEYWMLAVAYSTG